MKVTGLISLLFLSLNAWATTSKSPELHPCTVVVEQQLKGGGATQSRYELSPRTKSSCEKASKRHALFGGIKVRKPASPARSVKFEWGVSQKK